MSYLTRLSAHTLKIDQSLVRGVEADTLGGRLVSNIVQMGRDLGYRMVAEGIETEAERALLTGWGCDFGQGWHFGRPMPAAAVRGVALRQAGDGCPGTSLRRRLDAEELEVDGVRHRLVAGVVRVQLVAGVGVRVPGFTRC